MRSVNLDALEREGMHHTVTRGDTTYPVRAITPRIASIIDAAAEADGVAKLTGYYNAVALLVPSMPREMVDDLTIQQTIAIVELAGTEVRAVDEAAAPPNAPSSAPSDPAAEPTVTPSVAC